MSSSDSSCDLDVIPTSLLKSCLDVLIKPITIIVNLSLSEGSFPTTFKHALVKPLLKKHNLPQDELSSYRPISNLNFISKVLERIIHARISSHLESFPSITPFQSANIGSFIPLKLPFFVSKMIFFLQSINKKFQPWYFSICLPLLIRLIIKFSCPGYPLFMVSPTRH